MGGNALKDYGVTRVDRATYIRIRDSVLAALSPIVERAQVPFSLENKPTFGDVDILAILKQEATGNLRGWITETFKPRAIVHNANVWSFNVEDLQIDLITTSQEDYEVYFHFLCWGDMSMAMGRVSRLYDLKFGIDGLSLPIRDPETNHVVSTLNISKVPREIYTFLGYDYERWLRGFASMDEVIAFIFSTPRMHNGFMTADSENTKARRREAKDRVQWIAIMNWYKENQHRFPSVSELADPIPLSLVEKIHHVEAAFPQSNLYARYLAAIKEISDNIAARDKFSGTHIQQLLPQLQGSALGVFMAHWTKQWPTKNEQVAYILSHTVPELEQKALDLYASLPK